MLKVPAIDLAEVGAGGGSLAGIDKGGLLKVGPESAGAVPGPACYGLGNDQPTVTDANVVLGLINPRALAGGRLAIDRTFSERAILTHVAKPLGLSLEDAAHGIRAVTNAAMSRAIRAVTVERGRDPRDLTLIATGGNGGIHALDLARDLGIGRVVVPPLAGVFSAVIVHEQAGAGGFGDPTARDPALVHEDLLDGKITAPFARLFHGKPSQGATRAPTRS